MGCYGIGVTRIAAAPSSEPRRDASSARAHRALRVSLLSLQVSDPQ